MDIEHLGESTIEQLVDRGLVKHYADVFRLKREDVLSLEGFAEKSTVNLLAAIERAREPELYRLIFGLGIRHVGESTAKLLARRFRSMESLLRAREEELQTIHEVGPEVARSVHESFADPAFRAEIERLLRQMRSAVELTDASGRWMTPEEREQKITQAMTRLEELGLARRRRVAGYWRNPKLLTFAREAQRRFDALAVPAGPLPRRDLLDAAVGGWALHRGLLRPRGALIASLRVVAASPAHPDFLAFRERVEAILDASLRASSAIECLNSLWRVYQQVKKSFGTDFAYLVALHHNMHEFREGPRRGKSPFDLLGLDPGTRDWLSLIV